MHCRIARQWAEFHVFCSDAVNLRQSWHPRRLKSGPEVVALDIEVDPVERKPPLVARGGPQNGATATDGFYSVGAAPPPRLPVMILRQFQANQQHSHWSPSLCELSETTVSLYPA